jgi:hypothetical protein
MVTGATDGAPPRAGVLVAHALARSRFAALLGAIALCVVGSGAVAVAPAAPGGKTADVVVVSGTRAHHFRAGDTTVIGADEWYLGAGVLLVSLRTLSTEPIEMMISGRGAHDLVFFEPVALWEAVGDKGLLADLAGLLTVPATPTRDARLAWARGVAGERAARLGTRDPTVVWPLYQAEGRFASELALGGAVAPRGFLDALGASAARVPPEIGWRELLLRLRTVAKPVLRTSVFAGERPRAVAYVVRVPGPVAAKATLEVSVAAGGLDPERVPVTVDVVPDDSVLKALLTPSLSAGLGAVLGLLGGYLGFRAQQDYTRRVDEQRRFDQKKVEMSEKLAGFFSGIYTPLHQALETTDDGEAARRLREALVQRGIYAILRLDDAQELDRVGRPEGPAGKRRAAVHAVVQRNFREFL